MKMFHSIEDLNERLIYETAHIARENGFDTIQQEDDGHVLCGKHGTAVLVDVYPDGSWMVVGLGEEDGEQPPTGRSANMLGLFFANQQMYMDLMSNEDAD